MLFYAQATSWDNFVKSAFSFLPPPYIWHHTLTHTHMHMLAHTRTHAHLSTHHRQSHNWLQLWPVKQEKLSLTFICFFVFVWANDDLIDRKNGRHRRAHHHLLLPVRLLAHRLRGLPLMRWRSPEVVGMSENFGVSRETSKTFVGVGKFRWSRRRKMRPKKRKVRRFFTKPPPPPTPTTSARTKYGPTSKTSTTEFCWKVTFLSLVLPSAR